MQERTVAPAADLISTADAKAWLRVTSSSEDALIDGLVSSVTEYLDGADGILGHALITQTWALTLPQFPSGNLVLSLPPVQSVSSVEYFDADNASQTFSAASYRLVKKDDCAVIELLDGFSWPTTFVRGDAVTVTFATGYGDAASDVPQPIVTAAKLMLANLFENRQATTEANLSDLPFGARMLLMPYRVPRGHI